MPLNSVNRNRLAEEFTPINNSEDLLVKKHRVQVSYSPDGLTESVVDLLIAEVDQEVVEVPAATSALVDGSAAERRRRRIERRMLAAVVRSLPSLCALPGSVGEAA